MDQSKIKLILHPVRMKIIQSLVNRKKRTAQQLKEQIANVPPATLYRHINALLEAGLIEVVQENQIRGTVEKVFALKEPTAQEQQSFLEMSKEEHMELFFTFTAQLIGSFERYLQKENADFLKDGVSYRMAELHVTDEEFFDLVKKIGALIQQAAENEPAPERNVKQFATMIIPE